MILTGGMSVAMLSAGLLGQIAFPTYHGYATRILAARKTKGMWTVEMITGECRWVEIVAALAAPASPKKGNFSQSKRLTVES